MSDRWSDPEHDVLADFAAVAEPRGVQRVALAMQAATAAAEWEASMRRVSEIMALSRDDVARMFEALQTSFRLPDRPVVSERTVNALRGYSVGRSWLDELTMFDAPATPLEVGERVRAFYLAHGHLPHLPLSHLLPRKADGAGLPW